MTSTTLHPSGPRGLRPKCLVAALAILLASGGVAEAQQVGTASGLPVPRYVSLKSDHVNLREGPSKEHRTLWIYQRAGLPVEITAEFETWRKIRDSEGTEGWVLHSLLSGRRTALVAPWKKDTFLQLRRSASDGAAVAANLQPSVLTNVKRCDDGWCHIFGDNYDGYIQETNLWGVYPDEKVD
ncbi:SH3 domain-containing protein [Lichenihabitans sp. Uapishka_5]|uniref:SH3 domain-containing protein n=1 Tax=Lichenihabitans sp. Uapishka_5 TaxID=3037302 RepID=UPI0029E8078E|nr:SH3 domain-containing protein [Lichenihabitans sp. Uapishka_5]MDX7950450.1 SH3 domain-containing protein [Lichenihabitans sp. Uapishka_5]